MKKKMAVTDVRKRLRGDTILKNLKDASLDLENLIKLARTDLSDDRVDELNFIAGDLVAIIKDVKAF